MAVLVHGTTKKLIFSDDQDFHETLGMLVRGKYCRIRFEQNHQQGARGPEGRIEITGGIALFNNSIQVRYTAGRGNLLHRVNCTAYIEHLMQVYGFYVSPHKPTGVLHILVHPLNYYTTLLSGKDLNDFMRGYNR